MNRAQSLQSIQSAAQWDVVVIGGGASGLGIALEACTRGHSTLLVEQSDFAKATSSKSTKLIHGGVRYLAQGNVSLVREASVERGLLAKNAPHIVSNQSFIIPVYNFWERIKYTLGLKIYDWIAGRLSLGPSAFISRKAVLKKLPGIVSKNLFGGVLYHDGQFDDARLAISLAQTIADSGGCVINYMKATGLYKENDTIAGVHVTDELSGETWLIKARTVVNATGVFADELIQMDMPGANKNIAASQGIHLVLDKKFFTGSSAMMIPETSDGRVLFIVPWHDKVLVGTTDTPVSQIMLEPVALDVEISFILKTVSMYLTVPPLKKDVLSVFAGLRPLAAPQHENAKTKEISRSHKIIISPSKLFTIIGGKWTTYRKMGEDMIDTIEKDLHWPSTKSVSASLHIHGFTKDAAQHHSLRYYGSDEIFINKMIKKDDQLLSEKLKVYKAQLIWAIENEMVQTVEDFLSRRTRCLLLDAAESIAMAQVTAKVMAEKMMKDTSWISDQVQHFKEVAANYCISQ